ncbi:MAG: Uncharacterised protein [Rhodospirillaceae bacterium]|jgi:hypothetical protein|nr:MAG: Uncharacterised protein [Rhodospirillaceae bacterium]HCH99388.1 hypothetical protein [Alphaproteobacteria bacterium]|tara:strand:- start:466 stop:900 length:435 start_codon:yes stop_codon:yes gene_type:complete
MEELEIFNAQTQGYIANGLFQIAVIIGVFIVFRAARFARQNNIIAKGLVSLFSLIIGFFSLSVGSLRPQLEQLTALRLADAQAAGATLTANTQAYIAQFGVSAGDVLPAQQNLFGDIGTTVFTLIFLLIALGTIWLPNTDFSEK